MKLHPVMNDYKHDTLEQLTKICSLYVWLHSDLYTPKNSYGHIHEFSYDEQLQAWNIWAPSIVGSLKKFVLSVFVVCTLTNYSIHNVEATCTMMYRTKICIHRCTPTWTPSNIMANSIIGTLPPIRSHWLTKICWWCLHSDLRTLQYSYVRY